MAEQTRRRVPLVVIVAGGLLIGAGLFGAFRGMRAEPLPEPALPPVVPVTLPDTSSVPLPTPALPLVPVASDTASVPLPAPALPTTELPPLPPVSPAGGIVPPVPTTPPVDVVPLPKPDLVPLPKPEPIPAPKADPLPPVPMPKAEPLPSPTPLPKADPVSLPKPAPLPAPLPPSVDPTIPKLPEPTQLPQPVTPGDPLPAVPPMKPENGLRPELPPPSVNGGLPKPGEPVPLPAGREVLPPPRKVGDETLPPPRPVVEEISTPARPLPSPPGTAPMTPKNAVLTALMGVAVSVSPLQADEPKPAEVTKAQLDELKADIATLKTQKRALEVQLYGRDSDGKTPPLPTEKGVIKELVEAKEKAEKAEKAVAAMAEQIKGLETKLAQKSVSEKTPLSGESGITAGKGKVKLINEYGVKVSMMVNGTSYPLAAAEVKEVEVPAGALKYELVEFPNFAQRNTDIKDGETITLRIK